MLRLLDWIRFMNEPCCNDNINTGQRHHLDAVNIAKLCGTASSENGKLCGNYAVNIRNYAVKIHNYAVKIVLQSLIFRFYLIHFTMSRD